jgi:hypothetical protein
VARRVPVVLITEEGIMEGELITPEYPGITVRVPGDDPARVESREVRLLCDVVAALLHHGKGDAAQRLLTDITEAGSRRRHGAVPADMAEAMEMASRYVLLEAPGEAAAG